MKVTNPHALRRRALLGVAALIVALYTATLALAPAADSAAHKKAEPKSEKKAKKQLTGAELYAIHCGRCHPERYPTEFNAAQWKTILFEMRVRANLPASQARALLKYLQEESGK